jgi:cation transport ATPase
LLEVIESALAHALPLSKRPKAGLELQPALIRANLALAPIADYIFPALGLANAALIIGLSGKHVGPAARRLAQGKAGLDLLYTCIAFCTLTTFTFLPSALMYWFLAFWPQLTKKVRQEGELNFLARLRRRPRQALVERAGQETRVKVHDLKPGDVVILKEGDAAPADGVVVTGDAWIRENLFTGSLKPAKKTEGSEIYASTQVTGGSVHFRVGADEPRADRLLELYTTAFARPKTHSQATRIAELLVGPALLLGLAALGRGGIHMTKAVIRPDYLSGPPMAEDFGDFGMILRGSRCRGDGSGQTSSGKCGAPIVFLSPDIEKFSSLHSLCQKRNAEVKGAFAMATIPNVAAIGAAVVLSSPALVSVVMTTLGAATCYYRASRLLRQAAGR